MTCNTSPYLLAEPPTSTGRALLARAVSHWCGLHFGHSPEEIAAALDPAAACDPDVRKEVGLASRLLGELIGCGELRTYARPFGGGSPETLPASHWELDDFRSRMALSALDPKRPFDGDADPTHWIFVSLEDFNRVVEQSCEGFLPPEDTASDAALARQIGAAPASIVPSSGAVDRHVRLPELVRRTGMSRSTIYRRISEDRFPQSLPLDGNISVWRESEVAAWLADPR